MVWTVREALSASSNRSGAARLMRMRSAVADFAMRRLFVVCAN
jgi:hypothetical protein